MDKRIDWNLFSMHCRHRDNNDPEGTVGKVECGLSSAGAPCFRDECPIWKSLKSCDAPDQTISTMEAPEFIPGFSARELFAGVLLLNQTRSHERYDIRDIEDGELRAVADFAKRLESLLQDESEEAGNAEEE